MMYTIFQKPVHSRGYVTTVLAVLVAIFTLLSATGGVSAQAICNITNYDETLDDGWAVSALSGNPSSITWNNLTGRTWKQGQLSAEQNSVTFYTQDLPSGLYLCTVQTQFGLALTAKIAIQH